MKPSSLYRFLLGRARTPVLLMIGAGALSGVFSVAVLALISRALTTATTAAPGADGPPLPTGLALAFAALAAGKVLTQLFAQLLLVRLSQGTLLELSLALSRKVLDAPLRRIEQCGSGRVLATLTDDVSALTWAVQCLPQFAMNAAVVLGCAAYLAWLSGPMFLGAAAVTLAGGLVYKLMHDRAFARIHEAREARSRLFEHFRGLTAGVKELMMHGGRREAFVAEELQTAADDYRRSNLAASSRYAGAEAWIQALFYGLVGLLLFAFPAFAQPSAQALTAYVFAMLYMMGPLWALIGTVPTLSRGQVALQQIERLGIRLDAPPAEPHEPATTAAPPTPEVPTIELRDAVFGYADAEAGAPPDDAFTLGPIDFRLHPGELVFVAGGNGSGKSTFVKLLTGLYPAQRGSVSIGGRPVTAANRAWYRDHFSVVFADFHLFDRLLGLEADGLQAQARRHLELLRIDHKVRLDQGRLSTTDLSQGQRKRLALVTAYLEDRPFYVFDEWAADQDPEYKDIFYSRLLPGLRERGKGVVVITHDDRYFHLGDRLVRLEDGRLAGRAELPLPSVHP